MINCTTDATLDRHGSLSQLSVPQPPQPPQRQRGNDNDNDNDRVSRRRTRLKGGPPQGCSVCRVVEVLALRGLGANHVQTTHSAMSKKKNGMYTVKRVVRWLHPHSDTTLTLVHASPQQGNLAGAPSKEPFERAPSQEQLGSGAEDERMVSSRGSSLPLPLCVVPPLLV